MLIGNKRGIAVITVISIVGVGLLMAIAYLIGLRFESRSAYLFLSRIKARYVAESMVNLAMAMIENDENRGIDGVDDEFVRFFSGSDVDVDGDGTPDARWVYLTEDLRASVKVIDESGKANLNCPMCRNDRVFSALVSRGLLPRSYLSAWSKILDYLKGPDGHWGKAGVDDNWDNSVLEHNGVDDDLDGDVDEVGEGVDDPGEYSYGDDRRIETLEQLRQVLEEDIPGKEMAVLYRYFTTYSLSSTRDGKGAPKLDLNHLSPEELVKEMLTAGVQSPWYKAVNLKDFCDEDFARSQLYTQTQTFRPYAWEGARDWHPIGTVMVNQTPSNEWQGWSWDGVVPGNYYCYLYGGEEGDYIGDVRVNGVEEDDVFSGKGLTGRKVYVAQDGKLELQIRFRPDSGHEVARFSRIELIPANSPVSGNKVISGIEAVRITEVYSHPRLSLLAKDSKVIVLGGWVDEGGFFSNQDAGSGRSGAGTWEFTGIPNGVYYVQVLGPSSDSVIGDVDLGWTKERHIHSGQWLSSPVRVYDGTLRITIENNEVEGTTCYFQSLVLSQEPDVEFVEICNISSKTVDIGGWSIGVEDSEVFPAFIPVGVTLAPQECKILTVDGFDNRAGVAGNGLSVVSVWPDLVRSLIVPLDFSLEMRPGLDIVPERGTLYLKDAHGHVVDGVNLVPCPSFASLRREAIANGDEDGDGNFDQWSTPDPDESLATPGSADLPETPFLNRPIRNITEMFAVPDGTGGFFSSDDVARIWSRLTPWGMYLYPFGHVVSGWTVGTNAVISGGIGDILELFYPESEVKSGYYRIIMKVNPGAQILVSIKEGSVWSDVGSPLWADESGLVDLNWVKVESGLRLRIQAQSSPVYLYYLNLTPNYSIEGRINLNTTNEVSLLATGISLAGASSLISRRPFVGFLGVSQVIYCLSPSDLAQGARFFSVNSDTFSIAVIGQSLRRGRVRGEARLWVGVERK